MGSLIVTFLIYLLLANSNCSREELSNPQLSDNKWTFESVNNKEIVTREAPYLQFTRNDSEHIISGFLGCNRFQGSAIITDSHIELSPLAMTRMYCEQTDSLERSIVSMLHESLSYELEGNKLKLTSSDGIIAELYLELGDN